MLDASCKSGVLGITSRDSVNINETLILKFKRVKTSMSQNVVCSVKNVIQFESFFLHSAGVPHGISRVSTNIVFVIYKYNSIKLESQILKKGFRSCNLLSQENKM
jgi:hypothetical protein